MNISDWITLAAVVVALGIGVGSLIQTNILRKKEIKERLLNEIIGWAVDTSRAISEHMISMDLTAGKDDKLVLSICNGIDLLLTRGEYIYSYSKIVNNELVRLVDEISASLKLGLSIFTSYTEQGFTKFLNLYKTEVIEAYKIVGEDTKEIIIQVSEIKAKELK